MTLNELFRNTNYEDTLFSDEARRTIEDAIFLTKVFKAVENRTRVSTALTRLEYDCIYRFKHHQHLF